MNATLKDLWEASYHWQSRLEQETNASRKARIVDHLNAIGRLIAKLTSEE